MTVTAIMERSTRTADDLQRPAWNSLEHNYDVHDVGEAFVRQHCSERGLDVEAWGIDKRDDDGGLIFDDKMDLQLYGSVDLEHVRASIKPPESRALAASVEVKTKRSANWYGTINARHLRKYLTIRHAFDVPTYIYMAHVDEGGEHNTIERDTFIPLVSWDEYQAVLDGDHPGYDAATGGDKQFLTDHIGGYELVEYVWRAPDGNKVVTLDVDVGLNWPQFTHGVYCDGLGYSAEQVREIGVRERTAPTHAVTFDGHDGSERQIDVNTDNGGTDG